MALITVPWFIGAVFCIYEATVDSAVAKRQKTAFGIIVAHEAWNHNQYRYSFAANGASYLGLGHPPNEHPAIGDQVLVYYDPSDPAKSALKDFADMETDALGPVFACLLGVGAVVFYIWQQRRKMKPPPPPIDAQASFPG